MIDTRQATVEDAFEMAPRMRKADAEEVRASGGYTPIEALLESIRLSGTTARTTRYDGEIMGIWGVMHTSLITREGIPWLLTSDVVDRRPKEFFKICRDEVQSLRRQYDVLTNRIDARYVAALRWARKLGFEVEDQATAFGVSGLPFLRIRLKGI